MKIVNVRVVHMSDLTQGIDDDMVADILDSGTGIGRKVTWGDLNRALVNRLNLVSLLDYCCDPAYLDDDGVSLALLRSRILDLPGNVYIDLEN